MGARRRRSAGLRPSDDLALFRFLQGAPFVDRHEVDPWIIWILQTRILLFPTDQVGYDDPLLLLQLPHAGRTRAQRVQPLNEVQIIVMDVRLAINDNRWTFILPDAKRYEHIYKGFFIRHCKQLG